MTALAPPSLDQLPLPDKEINDIVNIGRSLPLIQLVDSVQVVLGQIKSWLESVYLAVFTLEQTIKQDDCNDQSVAPIEEAMSRMAPVVQLLGTDLSELLQDREENETSGFRIKITKIQSEWSSLQHFLTSVKKQLLNSNAKHDLALALDRLLFRIDDVSVMIFDFQEKKHAAAVAWPTSSSSDSERTSSDDLFSVGSDSVVTLGDHSKWLQGKEDHVLTDIDSDLDTVIQAIEPIYNRVNLLNSPFLTRKFEKVRCRLEKLQIERDELRSEYKEDRWLAVFRKVADQVDVMIDGLDRSVVHCYSLIQQMKEWQNTIPLSKGGLRNTRKLDPPIDKEKFRSVEKSFEAKYKYYTPSIDRMLTMLGNGISARISRDNVTSQRHESMVQRWGHLKEVMDELRLRDLVDADQMFFGGSYDRYSSGGSSEDDRLHVRSTTPSSKSRRGHLSTSIKDSMADYYSHNLLHSHHSDTSSIGTISSVHIRPSLSRHTPRPMRNSSTLTPPKEDFYDEDERNYGVDLMKRRPPSSQKMLNTDRKRPPSVGYLRSKTPNASSSTVNRLHNIRSKSSMGDIRTQSNRAQSPSRQRSMTPSFIPRPKTPNSPMIPRPKSSLRAPSTNKNKIPPVPPIPKYALSQETDYSAYRGDALRRKQSTLSFNRKSSPATFDQTYRPDPRDALDVEVAVIVNASPITIRCQKAQPGRYYFGNQASVSSMGGKKLYACKLMTYGDRRGGQYKSNKVLIRVGGGWQDLEFFLLEHSSFSEAR
jgi:hypothetical protein